MSDLPVGWVKTTFGEVTTIIGGGTPPSNEPDNFTTDGGTPWITPSDLSGYKEIYIERGARNLTLQGLRKSSAKLLPVGSVLFSSRAPVGYVAIAAKDVSTNQGFKSFVLPSELDNKYIYFYLRHIKPVAEMMATGTTFKELSGSNTAKLPLVIAPYNEQKRIVEKLDALLTRVDSCQSHLERVPQILKRFRQSVLAAATSGRLTEEWRNSRQYPERALEYEQAESPDSSFKIPANWKWISIGRLAYKVSDGVHKKPKYQENGVPFLTVKNMTAGPGLDFANAKYITQEDHEEFCKRTLPEKGDILVSKDGTLGVIRLVDTDQPFSIFVSIALVKVQDKRLSPYVSYAMQAPVVQKQMIGVGSGLQHIHLVDLRQDIVPMPPLEEQVEIVRRVEKLFAYADRLEARYWFAMERVEHLTPSLLAKAFRGELVEQDPSDEPASVLLERIRKARETNSVSSRKTKSADH